MHVTLQAGLTAVLLSLMLKKQQQNPFKQCVIRFVSSVALRMMLTF